MAELQLSEGFSIIEEGEHILSIKKAELKPPVNPEFIVVEFADEYGRTMKNRYPLDPSNQGGFFATSQFLRAAFNNPTMKSFNTDDVPRLQGVKIRAEVVHSKVPSKKNPEKLNTFANIGNILGGVQEETGGVVPQGGARL